MTEIEINNHRYRVGKLNLKTQAHMVFHILPLLTEAYQPSLSTLEIISRISKRMGDLPHDRLDYVMDQALSVVQRQQQNHWARVNNDQGQMMFDDIALTTALRLMAEVFKENFSDFLHDVGSLFQASPAAA